MQTVFVQRKFNVQTSHQLINCHNILLTFLSLNAISIVRSVLALFATFSNANLLGKAFKNFNTVQSTWPPSWISKKVLYKTYDVTNHVQC